MEENRPSALSPNRTELDVYDSLLPVTAERVDSFYLRAATRPNTRKAYQSDIQQFIAWGGVLPASAESVMRYLHEQATVLNPRTLARRLIALRHWHEYQGFADPTRTAAIQKTLRGIFNTHGKPKAVARPLILEELAQLVKHLERQQDLTAWRNLALLQVGFFGSFRRSELVGIQVHHLTWLKEGIEILIPRSKTDPQGEGQICAIPYGNDTLCAVRALKHWLEKAAITTGPVFRAINRHGQVSNQGLSADSVNILLKQLTKKYGFSHGERYKGHSLRRGFVTSAFKKGVSLPAVMNQGRWKDAKTVLGYFEEVQRFEQNAVNSLMKLSDME